MAIPARRIHFGTPPAPFGPSCRSSGRRSGRGGSGPAPGRAMLRRDILTNFATSLELGPGSLGDGSRVSLTSLTVYGKWQQMRGQKFLQQIPMSLCPLGVEGMGARRARCPLVVRERPCRCSSLLGEGSYRICLVRARDS